MMLKFPSLKVIATNEGRRTLIRLFESREIPQTRIKDDVMVLKKNRIKSMLHIRTVCLIFL